MAKNFAEGGVVFGLRLLGFKKGFGDINKGMRGAEKGLGKFASSLSAATAGNQQFVRSGVEGYLDMSTRLRRTSVILGGTADDIENVRRVQAKARTETGMNAQEFDNLRDRLIELGETSGGTAVEAAKMSKVIGIDPDTTAQWIGLGKQMGLSAQQTMNMKKEATGLLLTMNVPPTAFFEQPAELAEIMRTRMISLGKQSPETAKRFTIGAAAMTAALSKAGIGMQAATSTMMNFASGSADALFDISQMTAGLGGTDVPEMVRMTSIGMQSFEKAVAGAADAPDVLISQLAKMTQEIGENNPAALKRWKAFVAKTVADKTLASVIVNNSKDVIEANTLAASSTEGLTGRYAELEKAQLRSPEVLRQIRDEQMKVLKEDIARNHILPITNRLVELQTKVLAELNEEQTTFSGQLASVGIKGMIGYGSVVSEGAGYVSDFANSINRSAKTIEGLKDSAKTFKEMGSTVLSVRNKFKDWTSGVLKAKGASRELRVFLQGPLLKTLQTAGGWIKTGLSLPVGEAAKGMLSFAQTAGPRLLASIASLGPALVSLGTTVGTTLVAGFSSFAAMLTTTVIPAIIATVLAMGPVLLVIAAAAALVAAALGAFYLYQRSQEKAGEAALERANKDRQAAEATVNANKSIMEQDAERALFHRSRVKEMEKEKSSFFGGGMFWSREEESALKKAREAEAKFTVRSVEHARGGSPGPETSLSNSPTPALPMGAMPRGSGLVRVAIQSLEEQRSQTGLMEQLVALMGASPGAATPPAAAGNGGGGNVQVTIRPDSGKMRLDRMLEVSARNTLGRRGYTQFGGVIDTA